MWSLWEAVRALERRIETLECENQELRRRLQTMQQPLKVKKVVYHVHALHIKEMSGTMNIGINAPLDEEKMEQMVFEMQQEQD